MFIDASAIVAILAREPGHEELEKRLAEAGNSLHVSPLVRFEASVALARRKSSPGDPRPSAAMIRRAKVAVDTLIEVIGAKDVSVTGEIGDLAIEASATYGKAVGHPADLNFGDCFAYACARHLGTRLLYKGNDFALTDLG